MKNKILLLLVVLFTFLIFKNYNLVSMNIINSCTLFIKKIFPSLFPMFVISSILIELDFIKYINIFFKKINNKFFKINENTSYILLMSIISGCPSNAKMAKELYDKNLISINDIQKIIMFSHFVNPIFILNNISHKIGLILVAHYIGNFIIGFMFRNKYIDKQNYILPKKETKSISSIFFGSINNAITTLLFILGTIVTFSIISSILNIKFLNIILELSNGINYLANLSTINLKFKSILLGTLLSFGGLCVHFQVYGILNELKIKYSDYLFSRILHSIITALIIFIFY